MSFGQKTGFARVDPQRPEAFGICDRCGMLFNLVNLYWQYEWVGPRLQNLWKRVDRRCLDKPHEFTRPAILPPDPLPVYQPRVENATTEDLGISAAKAGLPPKLFIPT